MVTAARLWMTAQHTPCHGHGQTTDLVCTTHTHNNNNTRKGSPRFHSFPMLFIPAFFGDLELQSRFIAIHSNPIQKKLVQMYSPLLNQAQLYPLQLSLSTRGIILEHFNGSPDSLRPLNMWPVCHVVYSATQRKHHTVHPPVHGMLPDRTVLVLYFTDAFRYQLTSSYRTITPPPSSSSSLLSPRCCLHCRFSHPVAFFGR